MILNPNDVEKTIEFQAGYTSTDFNQNNLLFAGGARLIRGFALKDVVQDTASFDLILAPGVFETKGIMVRVVNDQTITIPGTYPPVQDIYVYGTTDDDQILTNTTIAPALYGELADDFALLYVIHPDGSVVRYPDHGIQESQWGFVYSQAIRINPAVAYVNFTDAEFKEGEELVFIDGIKLVKGIDYTVTGDNSILLTTPVTGQDMIELDVVRGIKSQEVFGAGTETTFDVSRSIDEGYQPLVWVNGLFVAINEIDWNRTSVTIPSVVPGDQVEIVIAPALESWENTSLVGTGPGNTLDVLLTQAQSRIGFDAGIAFSDGYAGISSHDNLNVRKSTPKRLLLSDSYMNPAGAFDFSFIGFHTATRAKEQLHFGRYFLYVSNAGSDGNDGRSSTSEYATIAKALAESKRLTNQGFSVTIRVAAGAYTESNLFISGMRTKLNWDSELPKFRMTATGGTVIITGSSSDGLKVIDSEVDFTGLWEFSSNTNDGLRLENSKVSINNNVVADNNGNAGIGVYEKSYLKMGSAKTISSDGCYNGIGIQHDSYVEAYGVAITNATNYGIYMAYKSTLYNSGSISASLTSSEGVYLIESNIIVTGNLTSDGVSARKNSSIDVDGNVTVTASSTGFLLFESSKAMIGGDLSVDDPAVDAISVLEASSLTMYDVGSVTATVTGGAPTGSGLKITDGSKAVIGAFDIQDYGDSGIYVASGSSLVCDNAGAASASLTNGVHGLEVRYGSRAVFHCSSAGGTRLRFSSNTGNGIFCSDESSVYVGQTDDYGDCEMDVRSNSGHGVFVLNGSKFVCNNSASTSDVDSNTGSGVYCSSNSEATMHGINFSVNNGGDNIFLEDASRGNMKIGDVGTFHGGRYAVRVQEMSRLRIDTAITNSGAAGSDATLYCATSSRLRLDGTQVAGGAGSATAHVPDSGGALPSNSTWVSYSAAANFVPSATGDASQMIREVG